MQTIHFLKAYTFYLGYIGIPPKSRQYKNEPRICLYKKIEFLQMSNLLEITGDDIRQLDDETLRILIGLLCEADYRKAGLSPKGIRWGGHHNASDGGLDVMVEDLIPLPKNSFISKKITGFQVKKPAMPPREISTEMRPKPKGHLRPAIKKLIEAARRLG